MDTPQSGIFALGTASSAYLEFDLIPHADSRDLVSRLASLREPRTTLGGVNLVSGFRPELWRGLAADGLPADVIGFNEPIRGAEEFVMPATQHDAVLWLSGSAYDVIFDEARAAMEALRAVATVADETSAWSYRHDRDLTGFIDGSENPSLLVAPEHAIIPHGRPGAGGTMLLLQKWEHDVMGWEALRVPEQERVIGRTKAESVELDPQVANSHVAMTDQARFGHIFRRNMPYGTVTNHGTMFVGFSAEQSRLTAMLLSMAGAGHGIRDSLTRYTRPLSGAFYFVPSTEAIRTFAASSDGT
jgi:putative iron-dependent peroxidase